MPDVTTLPPMTVSALGSGGTDLQMDSPAPPISTNESTGSGFNLGSFLSQLVPQGFGGSGNSLNGLTSMIPGIAGAISNYNNADTYLNSIGKYQGAVDPFSSQRGLYQPKLNSVVNDPNSFLKNDPTFQSMVQMGLGNLNRGDMAKTGTVSNADDIAFSQQLAQQYLPQYISQLSNLSGAQFGPNGMAALIAQAIQGAVSQRNAAMNSLGNMWGNVNKLPPGGSGTASDILKNIGSMSPQQLAAAANAMGVPGLANNAAGFAQYLKGITSGDPNAMNLSDSTLGLPGTGTAGMDQPGGGMETGGPSGDYNLNDLYPSGGYNNSGIDLGNAMPSLDQGGQDLQMNNGDLWSF